MLRYQQIFGLEVSGDVSYSAIKSKKDTCQNPRFTTTVNTASNTKLTQKCTYISNLLRPINNYMPFKYFFENIRNWIGSRNCIYYNHFIITHYTKQALYFIILFRSQFKTLIYIYCEFWRSIIKSPSAISLKLYLLIRDMPSLWLPKMYSNWVFACRYTGRYNVTQKKKNMTNEKYFSNNGYKHFFTVAWKMWQQHLITKFLKKMFESYTKVTSLPLLYEKKAYLINIFAFKFMIIQFIQILLYVSNTDANED